MDQVLEVNGLSAALGRNTILSDVTFRLKTGEIVGLFGRNGSGKSTLLKCVFGVVKVSSIDIKIDGQIIEQKQVIPSQKIGYLPQDSFLPKSYKVRDVIPLIVPDAEKQDAVFYASQVPSFDMKKVGELSLGQLRYLELLLIGSLDHTFLMLDEPFSMLEPFYKDLVKEYLNQLKINKGIIITDHYYHDVLELTDRNYLLKDGNLVSIKDQKDLSAHGYLKTK
ncbi:MAG: ATP-binding cassette domain-containing protein [Nonlabens sp.]